MKFKSYWWIWIQRNQQDMTTYQPSFWKSEQFPWLSYCRICLICPLNGAPFLMSLNLLMSSHSSERPRGYVKKIIGQSGSLQIFLTYSKVHFVINGTNWTSFYKKMLSVLRKKYSHQTSLLRLVGSWKLAHDSGDMLGSVAIYLR